MARIEEVRRLIGEGLSDRQIARVLHCRRLKVKEVRERGADAVATLAKEALAGADPAWVSTIEWPPILEEIGRGYEIKRVWEERAKITSYSNFWKFLSRRYSWLIRETVTFREFEPGGHAEVDWAGDKIPWWDSKRHEAHIFIGILCHSQLIFARGFSSERKSEWLEAHKRCFAFFQGVPRVTVPDNLKTGVKNTHLYDPDLNPAYMELARHYGTAIVPARVRRPRDKAFVECAVGIVMRLFRWTYRDRRFHSLMEVNEALAGVCQRINERPHSRFKISRRERFARDEKTVLKPLPAVEFEEISWRESKVHPDSTIALERTFYSVPHIHRGKTVRVKMTARQVEIFFGLERLALHPRDRSQKGVRVIDPMHLPPRAAAYREATPQNLLAQARFINANLHGLLDQLFQDDALANIRKAQGLVRAARNEIHRFGRTEAEPRVVQAVEQMQRFNRIRVSFFADQLDVLRKRKAPPLEKEIVRKPNNPMLRQSPASD